MSLKTKFLRRTSAKRTIFFIINDIIFIALSCYLGFLFRFDGHIPVRYFLMIKAFIGLSIPIIFFFLWLEKLYSISWSFVSINELLKLAKATIFSFLTIGAILFLLRDNPVFNGFPRSIIFMSGFLTFFFCSALRFAKRLYIHQIKNGIQKQGQHVLIIGAGEAGEQLVRHIISLKNTPYLPIGFIDDNPIKQGVFIHGIKVLGKIQDIPKIAKIEKISEIIIAMPSANKNIIKKTVNLARSAGIQKIKILPGTQEILTGKIVLSHLRDISIEDLLGREKVQIDTQIIENFIKGKTVLITGGAGSIGSKLCQQVLNFEPKMLIILDQRETACFYLERDLNKIFPKAPKKIIIGDICDKQKVKWLFNKYRPEIVFHAAAYKHVPMMESHPDEAVKNNIFGTLTIAQASIEYGVKKFVFISTDKAINPTSVMGATKRVGERICQWLNKQNKTKFCAVRFGNVLGSQGSVVPIFEKQIKKGGPVEVTHPEMKRYFMVTSEACLLVMEAGAIGKGGEVFVLDMGKPIKIIDLARETIRLAGYQPDIDIPIVFTKPRPGEKMFEEILSGIETPTKYEKILITHLDNIDEKKIIDGLKELEEANKNMDREKIIATLKKIVPTYRLEKYKIQ